MLFLYCYCQAWGPNHVQVNCRRLQGLKKLLVILRSQGLDLEIDSIIGRYKVTSVKLILFKYVMAFETLTKVEQLTEILRFG